MRVFALVCGLVVLGCSVLQLSPGQWDLKPPKRIQKLSQNWIR